MRCEDNYYNVLIIVFKYFVRLFTKLKYNADNVNVRGVRRAGCVRADAGARGSLPVTSMQGLVSSPKKQDKNK